ncbi:MAG: hypothetical protein COX77_04850 [Candidatus Komeilibacteria bacterium CG_4_10_14_0_2_um_filter_37_10]|uniref:L-asparaginase N-terminal domain-containing protein n=1 Tax=Candidatus Komeilibacteria bacterium CG_4_10_14_0_2_um_filter_37_10 TaxID=1974470 RepID=A0A2M7VD75_9BACT|nr:MAG: hypothetical protein COX77_04850 [Candidatus Komeilibacteria bacterium CG_4_10_14_0_2_um_filter_37_10]
MAKKSQNQVLIIVLTDNCFITQDNIRTMMPELFLLGKCQVLRINNTNATTIKHWQKIASVISQQYDSYEGFIVIENYHQVIGSAIATKLSLQSNYKSIAFVAVKELNHDFLFNQKIDELNLRLNIINSLQLIKSNLQTVMIVDEDKVIDPLWTAELRTTDLQKYVSINEQYLAQLDQVITITENLKFLPGTLKLMDQFNNKIKIIHYIDWLACEKEDRQSKKTAGYFIYLTSTITIEELNSLLKKINQSLPIVIYNNNQTIINEKINTDVIYCDQYSYRANLIKISWALGNSKDKKSFNQLFLQK